VLHGARCCRFLLLLRPCLGLALTLAAPFLLEVREIGDRMTGEDKLFQSLLLCVIQTTHLGEKPMKIRRMGDQSDLILDLASDGVQGTFSKQTCNLTWIIGEVRADVTNVGYSGEDVVAYLRASGRERIHGK